MVHNTAYESDNVLKGAYDLWNVRFYGFQIYILKSVDNKVKSSQSLSKGIIYDYRNIKIGIF